MTLGFLIPLSAQAFDDGHNLLEANSPQTKADRDQRWGFVVDYMKREAPGWVPGMPFWLRDSLGLGADENGGLANLFRPMSSLMHPPSAADTQAMWLSPGYNHKGFLPFRDTLELGMSARQGLWGDDMIEVRPFYAQSWSSTDGYWGTEVALHFRNEPDRRGDAPKSWGKIAIRFTDGDNRLMNSGSGYDFSGELNFGEHLSLNAGMRQNNDESDLGDYILLRWKLEIH